MRPHCLFPSLCILQLVATRTLATPVRELRRLLRIRLAEARDTIGFNLAALRIIGKVAQGRKVSFFSTEETQQNSMIWAGMGLGSDVAAALQDRSGRK
jgi:hypothetical protein